MINDETIYEIWPLALDRCNTRNLGLKFWRRTQFEGLTVGLSKVYMGTGSILRVYF